MPRLPTLRVRALADLARQLRYEPEGAARRQLGRAEALLIELLAARARGQMRVAYPEEWVVFRITGLRRERANAESDGASIVGEALLGDLAALIDRLSSAAKIGAGEMPHVGLGRADRDGALKGGARQPDAERWIGVEGVAARWGVSRKTVERARRRGLSSRRLTLGRGRETVVYAPAMVEAFERAWARAPARTGGKPRRISKTERTRIIARARRYRERLRLSMNASAKRLAARHGRARETVRRMLVGAGIAGRTERSRATGYRRELEERLAFLLALDLRGAASPAFERGDAAEVVLSPGVVRAAAARSGGQRLAELLALADTHEAPEAPAEKLLSSAYLYLLHRARRELGALRSDRRSLSARIDRVETDLRWAARVKAALVREQLPGALRSAESRLGVKIVSLRTRDAAGVVGAVVDALAGAIDRFDPAKGGRLAGAASLGVSRAAGAWAKANGAALIARETGAQGVGGGRSLARAKERVGLEMDFGDLAHRVSAWQSSLEPGAEARGRIGALPERERRVLELRFGWGGVPRTVEETAREVGTTGLQARAAERRAVARLMGTRKMPRRRGGSGGGAAA